MSMTKWVPTQDLMMLRRMGKLIEELSELSTVASRCIIQGIDEVDPGTGRVNRDRLQDEIADVLAQCFATEDALGLDKFYIGSRCRKKEAEMAEWESLFPPVGTDELKHARDALAEAENAFQAVEVFIPQGHEREFAFYESWDRVHKALTGRSLKP